MTNEELAIKIQEGAAELMPTLWEQVSRWVCKLANKWAFAFAERGCVEVDDLINSGYLALAEAVKTFQVAKGAAFTTWFTLFLKRAFLDAYGMRAYKNDPLHKAASLDAPIVDSSGKDITLGDAVADPRGEAALAAQEERIFIEQLHDALEEALATLPQEQSEILRLHYYDGQTYEAISKQFGTYKQTIQTRANKALRGLRKPQVNAILLPFVDFDYYHGTGVGAFQRTGASIQERYLLNMEREYERRERAESRQKEQRAKYQEEQLQGEFEKRAQEAQTKVGRMTTEEKARLLEKYGYEKPTV